MEGCRPEVDAALAVNWVYLPYTNQSSWAIALVTLVPDTDVSNIRAARAAGNMALRAAPGGLGAVAADKSDIFRAWGISACPKLFADMDLLHSCYYTPYEIVADSREVRSFIPAELEVRTRETRSVLFWPGSLLAKRTRAEPLPRPPRDPDVILDDIDGDPHVQEDDVLADGLAVLADLAGEFEGDPFPEA